MTISTMSLSEAAALVPMTADRLGHWAELGAVPGATHKGKRKHWTIQREPFLAGLVALQVLLAQVEHYGSAERNPATGFPLVCVPGESLEVEVTDAVRVLPSAAQPVRVVPWLLVLALCVVSFVFGMFAR